MKAFGKISTRIVASVVAGGLMSLALLTTLHLHLLRDDTREQVGSQVHALVKRAATDIDKGFEIRLRALQAAAKSFRGTGDLPAERIEGFFDQQRTLLTLFDNVLVFAADGRVLGDRPQIPGRRGIDASAREYFFVVRNTLQPYVSEPFIAKLNQRPVVAFAVPLTDEAGRFIGVLQGSLELNSNDFISEIRRQRIGEGGYFVVASRKGITIAHPLNSRIMAAVPPAAKNPTLHRALDGWQGWAEAPVSDGSVALVAYQLLDNAPWVVGGILPVREAYAPLRRSEGIIVAAGVAAALCLAFFVWWVLFANLRPLVRLREQIADLSRSGRTGRVDESGAEEIAALAMAFNALNDDRTQIEQSLRKRELFYRSINDNSPLGTFATDNQGNFTYVNRRYEELTGRTLEQLKGAGWLDAVSAEDRARASDRWAESVSNGHRYDDELRFERPDGRTVWVQVRAEAIRDADQTLGRLGMVEDVSAEREARRGLAAEKAMADQILMAIPDAIIAVNSAGCVVHLSPAAERLTGWSRRRVEGLPVTQLLRLAEEESGTLVDLDKVFAKEALHSDSWVYETSSGDHVPVEVQWSALGGEGPAGARSGILLLRDATERRQHVKRIAWEATHDALSTLLNRRGFDHELGELYRRFAQSGSNAALIVIDLDRFKQVNDEGGHDMGDAMLRGVAKIIQDHLLRSTDAGARLGGDEFAILLPTCPLERARTMAVGLLEDIRALGIERNGRVYRVGASIGIATFRPSDQSAKAIQLRADEACYRAKANGRDLVECEVLELAAVRASAAAHPEAANVDAAARS